MSLRFKILKKIQTLVETLNVDYVVLMKNENLFYVTGANFTTGMRVLSPVATLIVGADEAKLICPIDEFDRVMEETELKDEIKATTFNPLRTTLVEEASKALKRLKPTRIGLELDYLPYSLVATLKDRVGGVKVEDVSGHISRLRMVKEPEEIKMLEEASRILVEGVKTGIDAVREGASEREIAAEVEHKVRRLGASSIPMINLVASGPRLYHPHPHASDKKINRGELVMIDVACTFNHYNSDMTRFTSLGPLSAEAAGKFEFIEEVLGGLIDLSVEGSTVGQMWRLIEDSYSKMGYSEFLNHPLGRGIGVEIVEEPLLLPSRSEVMLRENMVLAFNPSLHIPGVGGWRLEDVVVVGKRRPRILTDMPWDVAVK